ncbi:uncharacterized protein [Rhodnius prolixus]|uniref:uncharacterized protein n=1 Tax=Rhodnius prolixus TaxID=13249 RepID=UPI003D18EBCD
MPKSRKSRDLMEQEELDGMGELQKKMERFSFDPFDRTKVSLEKYLDQFERRCKVKGLGGTCMARREIRKQLLLAYVGAENLGAVKNSLIPKQLDSCDYSDILGALQALYKPEKTIFTARIDFEQAVRSEEESLTAFLSRLKSLSADCKYGSSLDERLRDRFLGGVRLSKLEKEARMRWPDGQDSSGEPVKLEQVYQLARAMERVTEELKQEEMERKIWKQKRYHDLSIQKREFIEGQEVWIKNELGKGWKPGMINCRTGELSYLVMSEGELKRKHADQLRARIGATAPEKEEEEEMS